GAEQAAREEDRPRQILSFEERQRLPAIVCGVGVLIPGALDVPAPYVAELAGKAFSGPDLGRLIAEARARLERGDAAYALALGRDLHWADADELRAETLELLVRAYRMLGRGSLAGLVEVHHAHRDLPNVTVFER